MFPKRCKSRDGKDGESVAVGPGTFAKGGAGGKGSNGGQGGNGGHAVALGSNSKAIGGRGGDAGGVDLPTAERIFRTTGRREGMQ
jgi:hypothetical protein